MKTIYAVCAFAALLPFASAQTYTSGQTVYPAYEGWEKNADGTFNLVFGYMNENWGEEPNVPVGPENSISPGPADQGQPTHFLPRRNRFVFRIKVPKDFGTKEVVWTLTVHGKTSKAYATLRQDLMIENIDIMSEAGALGAGSSNPELRGDKPPEIKLEMAKNMDAKVGQPVSLPAVVTDDGIPRARRLAPEVIQSAMMRPPQRPTVQKFLGLHLSWFVYRGAGEVKFSPAQIKPWEDTRTGSNSPWAPLWSAPPVPPDGRYMTTVTFSEPGTYVLCARADDGALVTDQFITINVTR